MQIPQRDSPAEVKYCLRGYVGGIERTFPLLPGDCHVGSLESNHVFLPRRGVSRQHALLTVGEGTLRIEDLSSKNGTFVNGLRIEQTEISLGEEVRFGPVALRFHEFYLDDAELAIAIESASTDQTGVIKVMDSPLSGAGLAGDLSRHWLRLAESFHARLHSQPQYDIGAAIRLLIEELRLDGACLLEIPENGEPIVLAASGQLEKQATAHLGKILEKATMASGSQDIFFHTDAPDHLSGITFAALVAPGLDPLVLALWGNFPGRDKSELLLRLLVRMFEPCRPRAEPSKTSSNHPGRYPGLVVPPDYVYAQSEAMRKIYTLMQNLALGDLPILIIGETGVGKEYLSQILHSSSPRRQGPFIAINCAAIPAELLEAELFGIGEGVATGVAAKKGHLQMANGGTIFLDEIGDMSVDLQAKLLRALQEKEVHPVGREPVNIDVRVLAATNQELIRRIESGSFRSDLYYRLAGYVLEIPPLRERPEDVPALVEHFLRDCSQELERPIRGVTVRALRLLTQYSWPGNVRQLANEVRRAVYLCPENGTIESSTLSKTLLEFQPTVDPDHSTEDSDPAIGLQESGEVQGFPAPMGLGLDSLNLEQLEIQAIEEALRRCRQNQVQAAKLLGLSRQALRRRMDRFGLLRSGEAKSQST